MTITPGNYDITIYQGTTFSQLFTWKDENNNPVDLTNYTARMMARTSVDNASPFLTLTTEDGGIALGGATGTITLSITSATTAAMTEGGIYDLELQSAGGVVTRLLQGNLIASPEVTR